MPEGDTIHNLAARLRRVLAGRVVRRLEARTIPDARTKTRVGRTVVGVEALGKNLLVRFDDGSALHLHLRMLGRVFVDAPGATRRPCAQLELEVDGALVRGHRLPVLRLLGPGAERRAPELRALGPDLLAEEPDHDEAIARLRALGGRAVGEALLVQRAASGIGNVYKSEILFLEKTDPRAAVAQLDDEHLRRLLVRARALLQRNLGRGARRTRSALAGPRLWVYGRGGEACLACGFAIARILQGAPPGRSTYFCPRCQTAGLRAADRC
jgi:endonuclease VIII